MGLDFGKKEKSPSSVKNKRSVRKGDTSKAVGDKSGSDVAVLERSRNDQLDTRASESTVQSEKHGKSRKGKGITSLFSVSSGGKKKVKSAKVKGEELLDDEEIIVGKAIHADTSTMSEDVSSAAEDKGAFYGGFVCNAFANAINIHWKKSPESELMLTAMEEVLVVDGFFVGSIYAKSSFAQKKGGGMLM